MWNVFLHIQWSEWSVGNVLLYIPGGEKKIVSAMSRCAYMLKEQNFIYQWMKTYSIFFYVKKKLALETLMEKLREENLSPVDRSLNSVKRYIENLIQKCPSLQHDSAMGISIKGSSSNIEGSSSNIEGSSSIEIKSNNIEGSSGNIKGSSSNIGGSSGSSNIEIKSNKDVEDVRDGGEASFMESIIEESIIEESTTEESTNSNSSSSDFNPKSIVFNFKGSDFERGGERISKKYLLEHEKEMRKLEIFNEIIKRM